MAELATLDTIEDLECVERNGVVRSLTRGFKFRLLPSDNAGGYAVLSVVLDHPQCPVHGQELRGIDPVKGFVIPAKYNALVVTERHAKMESADDNTWVRVIVKYEHIMDGPNQLLFAPPRGIIYSKGRSSVSQKPTNFYYPFGLQSPVTKNITAIVSADPPFANVQITVPNHGLGQGELIEIFGVTGTVEANGFQTVAKIIDADTFTIAVPFNNAYTGGGSVRIGARKEQITVSHTYPMNHPEHRNQCIIQGGEIQLPFPQDNVRFQGYLRTVNPWTYKEGIHRKLNAEVWLGKPPRTWLITEVEWDVLDPLPPVGLKPLYRFEFEAQHDSDGWDPDVVFKDKTTGHPPADVIRGNVPNAAGVLSRRLQDGNTTVGGIDLPAGAWKVPALMAVSYTQYFASLFER